MINNVTSFYHQHEPKCAEGQYSLYFIHHLLLLFFSLQINLQTLETKNFQFVVNKKPRKTKTAQNPKKEKLSKMWQIRKVYIHVR